MITEDQKHLFSMANKKVSAKVLPDIGPPISIEGILKINENSNTVYIETEDNRHWQEDSIIIFTVSLLPGKNDVEEDTITTLTSAETELFSYFISSIAPWERNNFVMFAENLLGSKEKVQVLFEKLGIVLKISEGMEILNEVEKIKDLFTELSKAEQDLSASSEEVSPGKCKSTFTAFGELNVCILNEGHSGLHDSIRGSWSDAASTSQFVTRTNNQ